MTKNKLSICLWFDTKAEEAANFYTSIFPDSRIVRISHYTSEGQEIHGMPEGSVMTVLFEINGLEITALNGGPIFKFNESVSIVVTCDTQEEINYYWEKLTEGGEESYCGWLKDKYGLSWQIVPSVLNEMLSSTDSEKVKRVTAAFMTIHKFEIAKLEEAYR